MTPAAREALACTVLLGACAGWGWLLMYAAAHAARGML